MKKVSFLKNIIAKVKSYPIQQIYNMALLWAIAPFFLFILVALSIGGTTPIRYTSLFFLLPTTIIFLLGIAQIIHKEIPSYPAKQSIKGWFAVVLSLFQVILMLIVIFYLIKSVICNC